MIDDDQFPTQHLKNVAVNKEALPVFHRVLSNLDNRFKHSSPITSFHNRARDHDEPFARDREIEAATDCVWIVCPREQDHNPQQWCALRLLWYADASDMRTVSWVEPYPSSLQFI